MPPNDPGNLPPPQTDDTQTPEAQSPPPPPASLPPAQPPVPTQNTPEPPTPAAQPEQPAQAPSDPSALLFTSTPFPAAARAAQAAAGGGESWDDGDYGASPSSMSQLALSYSKYEASLYVAGEPTDQIEEKLAAWREQYAEGMTSSEIMFGKEEATEQDSQPAPQPETPPAASESIDVEAKEDGELRIR